MRHPYFDVPTPLVIGHRGSAGEAPENTLPSFARALAEGAVILESDVHVTRDGVPVLLHDPAVDRVSDGTGAAADLPLAALRRLDAGYRFTPDSGATHPFRGQGVRIPTLEETLKSFPGARFNLELKSEHPDCVAATVDVVVRARREALTLLTAGEDAIMRRLRAHLAERDVRVAQGACLADILAVLRSAADGAAPDTPAMALQIPREFAGKPLVTPELIRHAHAHDIQVHVWTVNDPAEMDALLDLGVDGIVTDFPGRLAARIAARRPCVHR